MATKNNVDVQKFTEETNKKLWKGIVQIHQSNLSETKQIRKSLKGGDFSGYRAKFDTKKVKKQITRSYGSLKSGNIGVINGFKAKDESWRMLNVLLHDRNLHQRYGKTLVRQTHEYNDKSQVVKRKIRGLIK